MREERDTDDHGQEEEREEKRRGGVERGGSLNAASERGGRVRVAVIPTHRRA